MIQRLALVLAVAVMAFPQNAHCGEPAADPIKLQIPQGVNSPFGEKDSKAVSIPKNLDDCLAELEKMLTKTEIEKMKAGPEDKIDRYYFVFSEKQVEVVRQFDQFLCDHWQLYSESRLNKWFKAIGIEDADDMGDIIVHSFWRHLNAKPLDLDGQIKAHQVYIPKDLDDCFTQLEKILSKETVVKMKNGPEKDMIHYHHGLGMWLRNKWGLWKGSRLSKWFNDKGIFQPDNMSGIILDSFWRHLNGKPLNPDEQIKHYQDFWKNVREERAAREMNEGRSK